MHHPAFSFTSLISPLLQSSLRLVRPSQLDTLMNGILPLGFIEFDDLLLDVRRMEERVYKFAHIYGY